MSISKLYISYKDYDFSRLSALHIDKRNIDKIIQSDRSYVCCTSLEDLFFQNYKKAIDASEEIELVDIDEKFFLNLDDISFSSYARMCALLLDCNKKVINFEWIKNIYLERFSILDKQRLSDNKTLWVFGCSFSEGLGVERHQRYGDILSSYYKDYDYVNTGRGGSSHWYHANKILQSDIKKDDIVVWNLTTISRIEFIEKDCFLDSTAIGSMKNIKARKFWEADYFESKLIYISTLNLILSVINYCKKMEAKLILANMLETNFLPVALRNSNIYIDLVKVNEDLTYNFIDLGSDNLHPGPRQHLEYAHDIHNFIQQRYFKK